MYSVTKTCMTLDCRLLVSWVGYAPTCVKLVDLVNWERNIEFGHLAIFTIIITTTDMGTHCHHSQNAHHNLIM